MRVLGTIAAAAMTAVAASAIWYGGWLWWTRADDADGVRGLVGAFSFLVGAAVLALVAATAIVVTRRYRRVR